MYMKLYRPLLLLLGVFTAAAVSARELPDFTRLVEKNAPAVVNISTVGDTSSRSRPRTAGAGRGRDRRVAEGISDP